MCRVFCLSGIGDDEMSYVKQVAEAVRDACMDVINDNEDRCSSADLDLDAIIASVPLPEPVGYINGSDFVIYEAMIKPGQRKLYADPVPSEPVNQQLLDALPDDYSESKDWKDADFIGRVEWLKTVHAADKELIAEYERQLAERAAIPAGWQLVPKEPTQEMLDAAYDKAFETRMGVYEKMIAAAPKAGEA